MQVHDAPKPSAKKGRKSQRRPSMQRAFGSRELADESPQQWQNLLSGLFKWLISRLQVSPEDISGYAQNYWVGAVV